MNKSFDLSCRRCPRLATFLDSVKAKHPGYTCKPVPPFGALQARLLIVGLAPGKHGANRSGRPFTGDHAGILLYQTLGRFKLAVGEYQADPADGLSLRDCRIANAVRCVPPANLPEPAEVTACNGFLRSELQGMPNLRMVLALGVLAHASVLKACGIPPARVRFSHGAIHQLPDGLLLADSYHVSRYNTNTGRLTEPMFEDVVLAALRRLDQPA
jgi:uracil-DNA glycosylase family 4